jgi:NAD-dependent deacetylase
MPALAHLVDQAAALLRESRMAVALTGAGISTPSGIPDFRSPGAGLWTEADPFEVASLLTFRYEPERFFAWVRPLARVVDRAQPNAAHAALAELEGRRQLSAVITQNIDGLHTRAGTRTVHEVHGTLGTATCVRCFVSSPAAEPLARFIDEGILPRCPGCGGLLKPDVTLMGEQLPARVLQAARRAARACDLMIVVGSSLEVMPAAALPLEALNYGARLIMINLLPTFVDDRAAVLIHADAADVLPRIARAAAVSAVGSSPG